MDVSDKSTSQTTQEGGAPPIPIVPAEAKQSLRSKKWLLVAAAIIILVGAAGAYALMNRGTKVVQHAYKIGIIAPLTGETASDGELIQRGVELASKDFNQEGLTIQRVSRDTLCDPVKAAAAVHELAQKENVVAIIGEDCSSATLGALPAANQEKVLLISPASSSPDLTIAGDYFFRTFPSDLLQGVVTAKLMHDAGLKRLAILHSNEAYGNGLDKAVTTDFEKLGGTVVASEAFEREAVDFKDAIARIKAANPDVLYIASNAKSSASAILLEDQKAGLKVALYGSESTKDQQLLDDVGSLAEGMTFTAVTEGTPAFIDKYRAAYSEVPASSNAAQSYDAYMAIARALKGGATNGTQIRDALYGMTFDGASGKIQFDKYGDLATGNYNIFTVKDDKFVQISQ